MVRPDSGDPATTVVKVLEILGGSATTHELQYLRNRVVFDMYVYITFVV